MGHEIRCIVRCIANRIHNYFKGAMKIYLETDRLILRNFTEDDLDNIANLDSDPEVMRYINHGEPRDREISQNETLPKYLDAHKRSDDLGYFAAVEKATGQFIGWFHLRYAKENKAAFQPDTDNPEDIELGYRLLRSVWGKGFATEGSRALLRKAFEEIGAQCVVAIAMVENRASTRVMEKIGMKPARQFFHEGLQVDLVRYELRASEFSG